MYSPKIKEDLVQRLYPLCQKIGLPMAAFVNRVLERSVLLAEEYMTKEEKQRVLDMIGIKRSVD